MQPDGSILSALLYEHLKRDSVMDSNVLFVKRDDAGDEAFFANSAAYGDKVEMMYVRVGNQIMVVSVTRLAGLDKEAVRAGMTTLAKSL